MSCLRAVAASWAGSQQVDRRGAAALRDAALQRRVRRSRELTALDIDAKGPGQPATVVHEAAREEIERQTANARALTERNLPSHAVLEKTVNVESAALESGTIILAMAISGGPPSDSPHRVRVMETLPGVARRARPTCPRWRRGSPAQHHRPDRRDPRALRIQRDHEGDPRHPGPAGWLVIEVHHAEHRDDLEEREPRSAASH